MARDPNPVTDGPVYDARTLGVPRMLLLGFQHTFAMFGATVLVPMLTGLSIATTLMMAGLGTLFFPPTSLPKARCLRFQARRSRFLGGYAAVAPLAG